MTLQFDDDADDEAEGEGHASGPTPTTSTKADSAKSGKSDLKRGQHGRHQVRSKVHAIHKIGAHGEPLEPKEVLGPFSNQCSCLARQYVPITMFNWKKVPDYLKNAVWGEVLRRFTYPEDQYDEDLCKAYALGVAGKAMRALRSTLNKEFVKKGKTPFQKYNFITQEVWEEFVQKVTSEEAKKKSEQYSELAKKNKIPHHLGMTGYAGKRPDWEREEREAAEAGKKNPLADVEVRGRHYFYARRPKKLKQGQTKYNEPVTEEAEKALLAVAEAKQRGEFQPRYGHDELTEALGNPEHRGRVRGLSSRTSWKNVASWQSDATSSHHTRQRYKEGLIQQGREEAVKEMIMGSIKEAFTSTDPKMVELRSQMLRQSGLQLPHDPAGAHAGQMGPGTSQLSRYPVDEIVEETHCELQVPFGRNGKKKTVGEGMALPPDPEASYGGNPIPPDYARVSLGYLKDEYEDYELDYPTEEGNYSMSSAYGFTLLWNKADIVLKPQTKTSQRSSPPGDPNEPDDSGNDDNGGDGPARSPAPSLGGAGSTSQCGSPPDSRHETGNTKPVSGRQGTPHPKGGNEGKGQCSHDQKQPAKEWSEKPADVSDNRWAAYLLGIENQYSTGFDRYI